MQMNELNQLSKDALIEVHRKIFGNVGDTGRTSKAAYIERIISAEPDKVAAALADVATSNSGSTVRVLAKQSEGDDESGDTAAKLAVLIQSLASSGAGVSASKVREIVEETVTARITDAADAIRAELKNDVRRIEITNTDTGETKDVGEQHKQFPDVLRVVKTGLNCWLAGPAGSGKTTTAENIAAALDLPFYFNGAIDTEYKLTGFIDANGRIVSTAFRKAYTEGGLYLFDECDASLAPATLAFNAALANGYADFPGGMEKRHKDFRCIAAANTWGYGATSDYIGRNKLDAAFLDRFVRVSWGYDETLERKIAGNDDWTSYVQTIRAKAQGKGLKVVISPRASIFGARLLAAGFKRDDVIEMTMRNGMTPEQWKNLQG